MRGNRLLGEQCQMVRDTVKADGVQQRPATEDEHWVTVPPNGEHPELIIRGGFYSDGWPIFVGRVWHEGLPYVANVRPLQRQASYACHGVEHTALAGEYQVLQGDCFNWEWCQLDGQGLFTLPPQAYSVGVWPAQPAVYVGRGRHQQCLLVGRVHADADGSGQLSGLVIAHEGKEVRLSRFQVLTKPPP